MEPVPVLVVDRGPQARKPLIVERGRFAEESLVGHARDVTIPRVVQMDAIDRELGAPRLRKPRERRREQIDEEDVLRLGDFGHGRRIEFELPIVLDAVRKIRDRPGSRGRSVRTAPAAAATCRCTAVRACA